MNSPLAYEPGAESSFRPHLAHFPNGPPPPSVLDSPDTLKMSLWRNSKKRSSDILVAETPKMFYSCQGSGNSVSNYYVAVFNKSTGKVRLVESSQIFKLQQSIKGYNPLIPTAADDLDYAEQRRLLVEKFGSRKKKLEARSKLANAVARERVSKKAGISETIKERAENQEKKQIERRTDLPEYNAATEEVSEIYPIENIVSPEELELFSTEADELLLATTTPEKLAAVVSSELYGNYVVGHLRLGIKEPTEQARKHKALLLTFAAHLLAFRKFLMSIRRMGYYLRNATEALPDLPEAVLRRFMELFSSPVSPGNERLKPTKQNEIRILNYILILCLTIDKFELDMTDISKDLRMQPSRCALHLQAIGCKKVRRRKTDESEARVLFKLTAPLQFPVAKPARQT